MNQPPTTANATYCAALVDQLYDDGLRRAFIAPGSRSTPLALALVAHGEMAVELFHDERSASFAALGYGLATGIPALVLCTSGTAGAHFYGAVIEADASAVPLIVCTADRPPELWGRGAPQTIDQTDLFGTRVRSFIEPGPPDDLDPLTWRTIARAMWEAATGTTPGPVHANLSFRDPLTGSPGELPPPLPNVPHTPERASNAETVAQVAALLKGRRGVLIAGRNESNPDDVASIAASLGWPIIADHRSGCRNPKTGHALQHFDSLLRCDNFAKRHVPEVVLRIGEIVSSKATSQWLSASAMAGTDVIASRPHGRRIDPEDIVRLFFDEADAVAELAKSLSESDASESTWLSAWVDADAQARRAIAATIEPAAPNEITIAQAVVAGMPPGGALVLSSSMPVRDVEWFGPNRSDVAVYSNRGANGIDGVVATAVGVALTGVPTVCFIGDVAFLHDASTLTALATRTIDLTIVVVDNDGGGIFSFLPQHDLLQQPTYEQLFGTPHGTDLAALVRAHQLPCDPFDPAALNPDGVSVLLAHTNRDSNLALHDKCHRAVAAALSN